MGKQILGDLGGWLVARFIEHQRDRWAGRGQAISAQMREQLAGCFSAEILERVRLVENVRIPVPTPPGYEALRRWTGWQMPDPTQVAGITFDHVVITRQPVWESLLFHELVHVTQFRLMGVPRFSEEYVRGFLETGSYEHIPLEACAYALEDRFLRGERHMDVEGEVKATCLRSSRKSLKIADLT